MMTSFQNRTNSQRKCSKNIILDIYKLTNVEETEIGFKERLGIANVKNQERILNHEVSFKS